MAKKSDTVGRAFLENSHGQRTKADDLLIIRPRPLSIFGSGRGDVQEGPK